MKEGAWEASPTLGLYAGAGELGGDVGGAVKGLGAAEVWSPLQGWKRGWFVNPGRCPGLSWYAPLGRGGASHRAEFCNFREIDF